MKGCHGHLNERASALDSAKKRLQIAGHKLTQTRQNLLKSMMDFVGPFSAEDLYSKGRRGSKSKTCDLVTVYRSLNTFAELGILSRVDFGDGVARYEILSPDGSHHHHIVCTVCRKIEPLTGCGNGSIERQEKSLAEAGYSQLSHRLEFFGVCPDCNRKQVGDSVDESTASGRR